MRVGFCVSGNGLLFRSSVLQRERLGITPALLVARPAAAADLEEFCAAQQVPMVRLPKLPRDEFDRLLTSVCCDAALDLLALTFDRILPPALVCHYARRIINVHPSLLPSFRGLDGLGDAMAYGVRVAGATIHEVIDEVDAGAIIAQLAFPLQPGESRDEAGRRMFALLEPMFLQVLRWYAERRIDHDQQGRVIVRDARYDSLPIVPALESF